MRSISKAWIMWLVLVVLCATSSLADATTAVYLSRDELVGRSTLVARVTVGNSITTKSDDGTAIVTRTEVFVHQLLKGTGPQKLVIQQFGGTYKGMTQRVLGDAQLNTGDDAVVFLRAGDKGRLFFTALALSVYHVDNQGLARRRLEDLGLVSRVSGKLRPLPPPAEAPEPVEHLMTDVVRIAGGN